MDMKVKCFTKLTEEGQLVLGDELVIIGKSHSDSQVCKVYDLLDVDGKEEVIISPASNKYFITDMYLNDQSWADDVFIITRHQKAKTKGIR